MRMDKSNYVTKRYSEGFKLKILTQVPWKSFNFAWLTTNLIITLILRH